jgi:cation diffusion facilitator CzcD-associated flavoprotein CzcO
MCMHLRILATGYLRQPNIPQEFFAFKSHLCHTATWDNSVDLTGKRIAVVGTGSSAVQTIPKVANVAERLVVYQR